MRGPLLMIFSLFFSDHPLFHCAGIIEREHSANRSDGPGEPLVSGDARRCLFGVCDILCLGCLSGIFSVCPRPLARPDLTAWQPRNVGVCCDSTCDASGRCGFISTPAKARPQRMFTSFRINFQDALTPAQYHRSLCVRCFYCWLDQCTCYRSQLRPRWNRPTGVCADRVDCDYRGDVGRFAELAAGRSSRRSDA